MIAPRSRRRPHRTAAAGGTSGQWLLHVCQIAIIRTNRCRIRSTSQQNGQELQSATQRIQHLSGCASRFVGVAKSGNIRQSPKGRGGLAGPTWLCRLRRLVQGDDEVRRVHACSREAVPSVRVYERYRDVCAAKRASCSGMDCIADQAWLTARIYGEAIRTEMSKTSLGQDASQRIALRNKDHHDASCGQQSLVAKYDRPQA